MQSIVLQDWLTIRGNPSVLSVTQTESDWLDVSQYQDVTFWLIFRELTITGAGSGLNINFQTAPEKDERLFATMATKSLGSLSVNAVTTLSVITATFTTTTAVALSSWLRWNLSATAPSTTWDVTFRIDVALNGAMAFPQQPLDAMRVSRGRS